MDFFETTREMLAKGQGAVGGKTFTPRAEQVLACARLEADTLNHNFVGAEHLLLGLIALNQGVAAKVLITSGLDLEAVRKEVKRIVGQVANRDKTQPIPYTPRARKILESASKQAGALGHTYIGTEHVLLGLLAESEGTAAKICSHFKVDREQMRIVVLKELGPSPSGSGTH